MSGSDAARGELGAHTPDGSKRILFDGAFHRLANTAVDVAADVTEFVAIENTKEPACGAWTTSLPPNTTPAARGVVIDG